MKVGTDGVLLGAWVNSQSPCKILDIGSGTGLIGLMLAQRFPNAKITGIEIDKATFEESQFNFEQSPFSTRLKAIHSSIQSFKSEEKFDLIVSNPPFFKANHSNNSLRSLARQQLSLDFEELIYHSEKLLQDNGRCAFIIPFESENAFINIAELYRLFPNKITRVKGTPHSEYKRSLLLFSRQKAASCSDELTLELNRNVYTEEYIRLTKDFYLKM